MNAAAWRHVDALCVPARSLQHACMQHVQGAQLDIYACAFDCQLLAVQFEMPTCRDSPLVHTAVLQRRHVELHWYWLPYAAVCSSMGMHAAAVHHARA
jgi:hypothetical protein